MIWAAVITRVNSHFFAILASEYPSTKKILDSRYNHGYCQKNTCTIYEKAVSEKEFSSINVWGNQHLGRLIFFAP